MAPTQRYPLDDAEAAWTTGLICQTDLPDRFFFRPASAEAATRVVSEGLERYVLLPPIWIASVRSCPDRSPIPDMLFGFVPPRRIVRPSFAQRSQPIVTN